MEIMNNIDLINAKKELEILIDRYQYDQMLVGNSKLIADPKINWLTKAIRKYEKETSDSALDNNMYL